jgi:hypothetical protein
MNKKAKYNKAEMWKSFLGSDHLEIKPWAKNNGYTTEKGRTKDRVERITIGWGKKKKEMLQKLATKIQEKFEREMEKNWEKVLRNVAMAEIKIINDMAMTIHRGEIPQNTKDLERVFKIFRLVLGKSISNNYKTNPKVNIELSNKEKEKIKEVINRNNTFYNRPLIKA